MYSNNIVNFQESTTILNAYTKMSGNLLNAPRMIHFRICKHLVSNLSQKYQEGPKRIYSRCHSWMRWAHLRVHISPGSGWSLRYLTRMCRWKDLEDLNSLRRRSKGLDEIKPTDSWTLVTFLGFRIVIGWWGIYCPTIFTSVMSFKVKSDFRLEMCRNWTKMEMRLKKNTLDNKIDLFSSK